MTKKAFLIFFIVNLISCSSIDSKDEFLIKDIEYQVNEIADELDIDIQYDIRFGYIPDVDGVPIYGECRRRPAGKHIIFNTKYFVQWHKKYGIENAWPHIVHELGHCSFGLKHQDRDDNGETDIMKAVISDSKLYRISQDKEYYIEQFKKKINK